MAFDRKDKKHYTSFLEELGCREIDFIKKRKHVMVKWTTGDGRKLSHHIANSPSDYRNRLNNESLFRRKTASDFGTSRHIPQGYTRTRT